MERTISRENEKAAIYFHCFWYQNQRVQSLPAYQLRHYAIAEVYVLCIVNVYGLEGTNKIFSSSDKNSHKKKGTG